MLDRPAARRTTRAKIEAMCTAAGLRPEQRETMHGFDLFMADGFTLPPHRAYRKFGLAADEFPHGAYVTFWWLMKGEDWMLIAAPLFFDAFHDSRIDDRKRARLNAARQNVEPIAERLAAEMKRTAH